MKTSSKQPKMEEMQKEHGKSEGHKKKMEESEESKEEISVKESLQSDCRALQKKYHKVTLIFYN